MFWKKKIARCHARTLLTIVGSRRLGGRLGERVGGWAVSKRTVGLVGDAESCKRERSDGQCW
jgi:hypothetical protein